MKGGIIGRLLQALRPGRGGGSLVELPSDPIRSGASPHPSGRREAPASKAWESDDPDREHDTREANSAPGEWRSSRFSPITSVGGLPLVVPTERAEIAFGRRTGPNASATRAKDASRTVAVDMALAGWVNPRSKKRRG
jgi:hypothetical protein